MMLGSKGVYLLLQTRIALSSVPFRAANSKVQDVYEVSSCMMRFNCYCPASHETAETAVGIIREHRHDESAHVASYATHDIKRDHTENVVFGCWSCKYGA